MKKFIEKNYAIIIKIILEVLIISIVSLLIINNFIKKYGDDIIEIRELARDLNDTLKNSQNDKAE